MSEPDHIFHIASTADISKLDDEPDYRCASLVSEGFIHCCNRRQLAGVASRYYSDVDDVHLMIIDVEQLDARLVLENTVGGDELFPHIYGPVNASCIVDILPFGLASSERLGLFY